MKKRVSVDVEQKPKEPPATTAQNSSQLDQQPCILSSFAETKCLTPLGITDYI